MSISENNENLDQVDLEKDNLVNVEGEDAENDVGETSPHEDVSIEMQEQEQAIIGEVGSDIVRVYRDNRQLELAILDQRKMVVRLLIALILVSIVLASVVYMFSQYPKYRVVQTVDNSVICEIDATKNPLLTDVALEDFAKSAVLSVYSFDYVNWQEQLNIGTKKWFTSDGRVKFNTALKQSGALDHIIKNNLIMRAFSTRSPQLEQKSIDQYGNPYWIVRIPLRTEFYTGQTNPVDSQNFIAQVRIVATKRDVFNPAGLGVSSLTLRPDSSSR